MMFRRRNPEELPEDAEVIAEVRVAVVTLDSETCGFVVGGWPDTLEDREVVHMLMLAAAHVLGEDLNRLRLEAFLGRYANGN